MPRLIPLLHLLSTSSTPPFHFQDCCSHNCCIYILNLFVVHSSLLHLFFCLFNPTRSYQLLWFLESCHIYAIHQMTPLMEYKTQTISCKQRRTDVLQWWDIATVWHSCVNTNTCNSLLSMTVVTCFQQNSSLGNDSCVTQHCFSGQNAVWMWLIF